MINLSAACENHSGLTVEINNIKDWQKEHNETVHKDISENFRSLQNRLPLWATFLIAFLSSIATWGLTH